MNYEVLEKYRKKTGLTCGDLSLKMGKEASWYSRIKNGKHPLRNQYIAPMATIFGIKPEKLAKEYFSGNELEVSSSKNKTAS